MQTFTRAQQTRNVALLGVTFLIMFTSFNSLQNIVSKIYGDYGYENLGQTSVLVLYFTFGAATFITPYAIRKFGYKKVMFISSLGYAVYEAAGLIIGIFEDMPRALGWIIVLTGALLCGASASMIWVAQGSYVSTVAGQQRKTELFGLFWMLMMSSQIVGNIITTFVLGKISNTVYFIVLTVLGVLSSLLFLFLPEVNQPQDDSNFSIKSQAKKITKIIKNQKYRTLLLYFFLPGVAIGFYATFLFKLVGLSIKKDDGEIDDDYKKRVSYYTGFVFIALGISQALTGFVMNRIGQKFDKFKLVLVGSLWIQIAGFTSLLCYFLENYTLCFLVSFLWGSGQSFLQTVIGSLIGTVFPGKVEAYGVYRIILALGTTLTIFLNIALQNVPAWVFLTIVMVVQVMASGISSSIYELKNKTDAEQEGSLVTNRET